VPRVDGIAQEIAVLEQKLPILIGGDGFAIVDVGEAGIARSRCAMAADT
jgi:hypothetical protein